MVSVYDLKPRFQALLRPITAALAKGGVTANHVTVFAMILSVAYGAAMYVTGAVSWTLIGLPFFLFIRMALNAIDGMLAREFGHKSDAGFYLNELSDVVSDAALYLPFVVIAGLSPVLVVLAVMIATLTELAGVLALAVGSARRYDGPFGKSDRAAAYGTLAFIMGFYAFSPLVLNIIFSLFIVLGFVTVINRAKKGLAHA